MVARSEETSAVHGSGEPVATKLHRIAEKARKEPRFKFTSLYHLGVLGTVYLFAGMDCRLDKLPLNSLSGN